MIDFSATHSDKDGIVHFCDAYGKSLRQYGMEQLQNYVKSNYLNLTYEFRASERYGMLEREVYQDVQEYIDENWEQVTEQFYNSLNKTEFKSNNIPKPI